MQNISTRAVNMLPRTILVVLSLAFVVGLTSPSNGQTYTTLISFNGTNANASSMGALVQGVDGNFYATIYSSTGPDGIIIKVTPQGVLTRLYTFCAQPNCTDGANPFGGLVLGRDGNLYGTTGKGGTQNEAKGGDGTIFKITPNGALTTLHSFCGSCGEGTGPYGPLIQTAAGNFIGTTITGGAHARGTVFKLTPQGTFSTLYDFCPVSGCADGADPISGVIQAVDGNFYGTANGGDFYHSTFFKLTPSGQFTTLYTFCLVGNPCPDGTYTVDSSVQGANGDFYGANMSNGIGEGGTIYKISPLGKETTFHSFCQTSSCPNGSLPDAGLVLATDGNFYGTAHFGGDHTNNPCRTTGCGTIYQITPAGILTALHKFCMQSGCPDGSFPGPSGVVQATDGSFYGVASGGGAHNDGAVFKLDVGLGPFAKTLPTSGAAGVKVVILGNNLTGTTAVAFNGTPATFKVVSSTEITTNVPAGATTGKLTVTTPSGKLSSNLSFRVP